MESRGLKSEQKTDQKLGTKGGGSNGSKREIKRVVKTGQKDGTKKGGSNGKNLAKKDRFSIHFSTPKEDCCK